MMGRKDSAGKLFYQFSLEERVPEDHLLRRVLSAVDFSFVRRMTGRFYSKTGQPSIDPVVVFKMALLGYLYGITSERRLVQEIRLNLAYMWFIGYDLDEPVPDHSVLSKARVRFGPTVYLGFFKEIVRQCEQAGLVRGDKVYLDSTLVQADANIHSVGSRVLVGQLLDIQAHVARLWQDNPDQTPDQDNSTLTGLAPVPPGDVPVAQEKSNVAEPPQPSLATSPETSPLDPGDDPIPAPSLHIAGPEDPSSKAVGTFNERNMSRVDPEAEVASRARVVANLYYKVHAGVDAGRARIVTAVEVTGGATGDEHLLKRLVSEHEGNVGRRLNEIGADTKYGTVENYRWLQEHGIRASIPMVDNSANKQRLPVEAFEYDPQTDSFRCPNDQRLTRKGTITTKAGLPLMYYLARSKACASCPRKEECCGKSKARSILVADDGGVRKRAANYLATFPARQCIRRRKAWIETIFGDGKERRGLRRAKCRGLDCMRIQAWMTAIAQNARQLALRKGTRPETGAGALEKSSPAPFFSSLSKILFTKLAFNHNQTSILAFY